MGDLYEPLPAHGAPPPPPPPSALPPPPPPAPGGGRRRGGRGRGGQNDGGKPHEKRYAPEDRKQDQGAMNGIKPKRAVVVGGAMTGGHGGIINNVGPNEHPQSQAKSGLQNTLSSAAQKSDQSYHFGGMDREYKEDMTNDPALDMANDMETNDIYTIKINREKQNRKKRKRIVNAVIIVMVVIGSMLTLVSLVFIAVDITKSMSETN